MEKKKQASRQIVNQDLLLPYGLPYFAYVGIASLGAGRISDELAYGLKIILVPALLYWAWKWYEPLTGPRKVAGSVFWGVLYGILGLEVWCLLMAPFIDPYAGEPWSRSAFGLRIFTATLIVPVFEELFIRGYLYKAGFQWGEARKTMPGRRALNHVLEAMHIQTVPPGAWSAAALITGTLFFCAGHLMIEWLAAAAYFLLLSILWIRRKDLLSCMVAHGTTNFGLALYVYLTGQWGFW